MDKPRDAQQLADFLGCSRTHVYQQCRARQWPHTRVAGQLRFTEEHVRQILALGEQAPITASVVFIRSRSSRRIA